MACIGRILVSIGFGSITQKGEADLESDATVAKLRMRLTKGLTRGAWPQSIIALDFGVFIVIGVRCWMEAWLRNLTFICRQAYMPRIFKMLRRDIRSAKAVAGGPPS